MRGRKLLRVGALLMVAGVLLVLIVSRMDNLIHGEEKNMTLVQKTHEVQEAFTGIHVEDVDCAVRILPSADGMCRVVCHDRVDGTVYHTVDAQGDELKITRHDTRKWYQFFDVSLESAAVEVYLPEHAYRELAISTASGSVEVNRGFTFERVSLHSSSGSIRMLSDAHEELKAESTSGRVTVEAASPDELTAKSVSGRVTVSSTRCGKANVKTTSGSIELNDVIAETELSIHTTSGSVTLNGCDGGSVRVKTVSGSVKGTLLSDKVFVTHTVSGSVRVPESAGGGACEIHTTSGSIRLDVKR